jgi:hypothetical protein
MGAMHGHWPAVEVFLFCAWELVCAATDFSASTHFGFFGGELHPRTFCFRATARTIGLDVRLALGGKLFNSGV